MFEERYALNFDNSIRKAIHKKDITNYLEFMLKNTFFELKKDFSK